MDDFEKSGIVQFVQGRDRKPNVRPKRKRLAAASLATGITAAALFGLSFTAFAEDLPVVGQVFKLFSSSGLYDGYGEESTRLGTAKTNNDISITLDEAVFDGRFLYVTYDLSTAKELGETPYLDAVPELQGNSGNIIQSSSTHLQKTGEGTYSGMLVAQLKSEVSSGDFRLIVKQLFPDQHTEQSPVAVDLDYQFSLNAISSVKQKTDSGSGNNDVTVSIDKILYTPVSFTVFYHEALSESLMDEWDFILTDIEVKDDQGTLYSSRNNGGTGDSMTRMKYSTTFGAISDEATQLIITPVVQLMKADGTDENGAKYRNQGSTAPKETVKLDEIVIDINK